MKLLFRDKGLDKNEKEELNTQTSRRTELMEELKQARDAMEAVYSNLSYVIEPDMIDCCIYELNALQLRYKIILNQMKAEEARACMSLKNSEGSADIQFEELKGEWTYGKTEKRMGRYTDEYEHRKGGGNI